MQTEKNISLLLWISFGTFYVLVIHGSMFFFPLVTDLMFNEIGKACVKQMFACEKMFQGRILLWNWCTFFSSYLQIHLIWLEE